jgi:hypothetical protein
MVSPVGGDPRWLLSADLDGDDDADLVVGDSNGRVIILGNNGTGTAWSYTSVTLAGWPGPAAIADLDGDGDLDLAITHVTPASTLTILRNTGGLTFAAPTTMTVTGLSYGRVVAARFDADADMDLAIAPYNGSRVFLLWNNGNATFSGPSFVDTGSNLADVAVADLDGNSSSDLVVAVSNLYTSHVGVFLNNGTGVFGTSQALSHSVPPYPLQLVAADLNGDSRPDIAVSSLGDRVVSVLQNKGAGIMVDGPRLGMIGSATNGDLPLRAADFNRDGRVDLLAVSNSPMLNTWFNRTPYTANTPRTYEAFPNVAIPDGPSGVVTSPPLTVPLAGPIADVDVQIDIQHPYLGDLTVVDPSRRDRGYVECPPALRGFSDYTATVF